MGEVGVRLYTSREDMVKSLPEGLQIADSMILGDRILKVMGYFDRRTNVFYSIDDARVVLHEFKHYLDPDWKHKLE